MVFLNGGPAPGNVFEFMRIPLVPMVVTENPADEEFWELEYRVPIANAAGGVDNTLHRSFILGGRQQCEEQGELFKRNGLHDMRCRGPHYLKRTGPPELVRPRRAYDPF